MSRFPFLSLFLIVLFFFAGNAWSEEDSNFKIVQKGTKQILVEYTGDAETVEIPEGVTSIGDDAFSGCDSVKTIVIPNGVTKIGDNAFSDCTSLTLIVFPKGVKKIGDDLFEGCQNLTIHAPRGSKIEEYAKKNGITFKVSSKKANSSKKPKEEVVPVVVEEPQVVEVPSAEETPTEAVPVEDAVKDEPQENVTDFNPADYPDFEIAQKDGKTILKHYTGSDENVVIPEGVTEIESLAFGRCSSLTSVVIPEGVTKIEDYAFSDCSSLTSVVISDSVKEIEGGAFVRCTSLKEWSISSGHPYFKTDGTALLTKDGKTLVACLASATEYWIPDGVMAIGGEAFYGCSSLTSVVIPEGVTWIGKYAFYGCRSLTSVVIPNSVKEIGDGAFARCPELTIQASKGSKAEEYAEENGIPFKVKGEEAVFSPKPNNTVIEEKIAETGRTNNSKQVGEEPWQKAEVARRHIKQRFSLGKQEDESIRECYLTGKEVWNQLSEQERQKYLGNFSNLSTEDAYTLLGYGLMNKYVNSKMMRGDFGQAGEITRSVFMKAKMAGMSETDVSNTLDMAKNENLKNGTSIPEDLILEMAIEQILAVKRLQGN